MTHFKKSLAMLLAVAMMFSSMSVAASAWKTDSVSDNDIRFTTVFFRLDDYTNTWVKTDRAAPGDEVMARVYLETTYPSGTGEMAFIFDSDYFIQNYGTPSGNSLKIEDLLINSSYNNYGLRGSGMYYVDESRIGRNLNNKLIKALAAEGFKIYDGTVITEDFFKTHDIITNGISFSDGVTCNYYTLTRDSSGNITDSALENEWVVAFELKVAESEKTTTIGTKGVGQVPEMYARYSYGDTSGLNNMFVDISVGDLDTNNTETVSWYEVEEYEPDFDSVEAYLTTTSKIIFDLNGGNIGGNTESVESLGIIKTSASITEPERPGYTFGGWELVSGKNNDFIYEYTDKTLKAIWTPVETESISCTVNTYVMNTEGVYEPQVSKTYTDLIEGQKFYSNAVAPGEGFYVDTETVKTPEFTPEYITISKDSSSNVLNVYYARNEYTVTYNYQDGGTKQTVSENAFHGAAFPEFTDTVNGVMPQPLGHDFAGWFDATDEGKNVITLPETVTANITLEAKYVPEKYTYKFYAYAEEDALEQNGSFSATTDKIISIQVEYGQDVTEEVAKYITKPSWPGHAFLKWESYNTIAEGNADIYPIYEAIDYIVEFYNNEGPIDGYKYVVRYGDEITADLVPSGYKTVDSWTLNSENGAVVNFPYTVTDNANLYATNRADVYDARFWVDGVLYATVPTKYMSKIEAPDYEAADGYTFSGWDAEFETKGDVMDDADMDFYATTAPKDITLTFIIDGEETEISGKFNEDVTGIPEIPAKEGYEEGTWSPDAPAKFPAKDTTYTATWEPTTNTLTFVDNVEGVESNLGTKSAKTGETIEAQPDPSKPGYTFTGWMCEDSSVIATAPTVMPAKSQKYVAQWEINKYDYSFDANGGKFAEGTTASGSDVDYGTEITVPVPERDGYDFAGWADASVENPTEKDVIVGKDADKITLEDDTALKAVWTQLLYKVTFDAGEGLITKDDGSRTSKIEENVAYGAEIPVPAEPARDGYTFEGWTEKTDGSDVPDKMPLKELYFEAKWEKIPDPETDVEYKIYAVTQIPGTNEYSNPVLVKEGSALPGTVIEVVEGEPANENQFKFSTLVAQTSQVLDTTKATSMTLTKDGANELIIYSNLAEFTVTFNAGDGAWAGGEKTATDEGQFGFEITKPATDPELTGYTFKGWDGYTDGDTFAEDKTYDAIWEIQTHDAIFKVLDENGEVKDTYTVSVEYGKPITLPAITLPEGYEYVDGKGWDIPADATMGEEDVTYTATIKPIDYTLTYVVTNSDVAAAPEAETINVGDEVTVKEATKVDGYTFVGWQTEDGATYPAGYKFIVENAADIKLTGYYDALPFDIHFDTNGEGYIPPVEVDCGEEVTELPEIPDDPDDDKIPLGWFTPDGEKVTLPFVMPAEDITLEYKWAYEVAYEYTGVVPEGAPSLPGTEYVEPGKTVDIEDVPTLDGYTFNGWFIDGEPAASFTMAEEGVKITGSWISNDADNYTVTYKYTSEAPAGAPAVPAAQTVKAGATVTPVDPEFTGYTFHGWFDENGEEVTSFEMPEKNVTLTGYWTKDAATEFSVSFKYTGETPDNAPEVPETKTVKVGDMVDLSDVPEVDGYTFEGWYYEGEIVTEFEMPANSVVITGNWVKNAPDEYSVSFKYTGETPDNAPELPEAKPVKVGDMVDLSDVPAVDGYTFEGWYYEGEIVTEFEMPANPVVITGNWVKNAPDEYSVSFKYTGETPDNAPELPEAKPVKVGDMVDLSDVPEVDGYTFEGWYYNGEIVTEFEMPANPVVITGNWVKNAQDTFNVTYAYTGTVPEGAPAVPAASTAKVGDTVTVEAVPSFAGYIFSGWYYNGAVSTEFEMPANDVVITGNWTEVPVVVEKYTLSLDPNGGTLDGSTEIFAEEYEEGTDIPPVAAPVREGYRFVRWVDVDGNTQLVPKTMPGNDVSLKAEWTQLYTVTYVNEDGTEYEVIPNAGAAGENIPAPSKGNPEKDGYYFVKWVDATTGETVTTIPEGGVTLKPVFNEIIPDTYTITYTYEGTVPTGAPALPETTSSEANKTIDVADVPELKGYDFLGWYYKDILTESFVMPAENVTIVGKWEVKTFSIVLDANNGEFEDGAEQFINTEVAYGTDLSTVIPAAPEREGYSFGGWVDDEGNEVTIPATMPDYDINAKADWDINTYEITFNPMGGTPVDPVEFEYGAEIKDLPEPTKDGFNFKGWTDAEGNDLPANMPANDIEAFAKWEAEPETPVYDLIIDANEGKFSDGKDEHKHELAEGESLKDYLKEEPTREGYEFIGWFDGEGNAIDPETATMEGKDTTITAEWEKTTYKVTYYLADGDTVEEYETKYFANGEEIVHPDDPTLDGFKFVGWFDKEGNELPETMEGEDLEAYAKFEINTYKVTYIVEGEVYEEYDVKYQAEVPVPADPKSSDPTMIFAGWDEPVVSTMPANDLVYTARFVKAPEEGVKFIAKFVVDGKTVDLQVLEEGQTIKIPEDPQKFGFKFAGWSPEVPSTMPAEDMTFEAQWEIDETFITIVIGGTVVAGGIIAGSIIGANAAWITGVSIVGGILVIVGVAELVKHTHTVTYIVDGEVYKTYKVVEGTKIPVPADPAKDGFKFEGWNPEVPKKMGETDLVFEATWSEVSGDNAGDDTDVDVAIPDTGSVAGGLAAFAVISGAAAAAYVITRRKKED